MDICGPFSKASIHGEKYFLTILDDFSRYAWIVLLLKSKSEVKIQVQNFISLIENQFDSKIKCIRTDNGPKFFLKDFFASKGIIHHTNCVYTPQQNGRVERKHQHNLNVARALMFQSQYPKHFWSYAIKHAIYLINSIPSLVTKKQTLYELLHNQKPDVSMLKVFGSLCYASTTGPKQKFDSRSRKGFFLGYQFGIKGYIILDLQNKDIFVSRDVIFYESHFPLNNKPEIDTWHWL